jgi:hypothetical protein
MDSTTDPDIQRVDKKLLLLPAIEPRFLNRLACSLVGIPTERIPLILQKSYYKQGCETHISLSTESCFSKNSPCSVYERNKLGKPVTINYTVRNLRAPTAICSISWIRKCVTCTCINITSFQYYEKSIPEVLGVASIFHLQVHWNTWYRTYKIAILYIFVNK